MVEAERPIGKDWVALADLDEEQRVSQMAQVYLELAELSEAERVSRLSTMEEAVYKLPEDRLRTFTKSRLRVWLSLDHDVGQMISKSYDVVTDRLSGKAAMEHVAMVQTMVNEFTPDEKAELEELFPRIFGALPSPKLVESYAEGVEEAPQKTREDKGPWWAFWKRG